MSYVRITNRNSIMSATLTQKPIPQGLLGNTEGVMQANRREKQSMVLPSCKA